MLSRLETVRCNRVLAVNSLGTRACSIGLRPPRIDPTAGRQSKTARRGYYLSHSSARRFFVLFLACTGARRVLRGTKQIAHSPAARKASSAPRNDCP